MKLSGPNAVAIALLGSSIILGGPWLLSRPVKYNIQIIKKEEPLLSEPIRAEEIVTKPVVQLTNEQVLAKYTVIRPEDVPYTRPWYYSGPGTLKDHIHNEHGVSYPAMGLFQTEADLKRLHSYLHNGGEFDIR